MQNVNNNMENLANIAIIIPCYNEELVIQDSIVNISNTLDNLINKNLCSKSSFVLFIDDGSNDNTWEIIKQNCIQQKNFKGKKLLFNSGHQNALMAGIESVKNDCDLAITIDADLQDDLSVIKIMIENFYEGAEIVCGVKNTRKSDSYIKIFFSSFFYQIMKSFGIRLIKDHADFRLMSSNILKKYSLYKENNLLLRAITPLFHKNIKIIKYDLLPRKKGKSKYSFIKSLSLGVEGITSFSLVPLRLITFAGFFIFIISFLFSLNALYNKLIGNSIPGWASITVPLYALGGTIMFSLGIVGEYIGKIFMEVKKRPKYIIEDEF